MIIRSIEEVVGTERDVSGAGWRSRRILRRDDGMHFSLHWTELAAGTELDLRYSNHLEANLIVAGEGEVVDVSTGQTFQLRPGTIYALDQHDEHILRATKGDLHLVCVFNPPVAGTETHNADGGYEPPSE